MINIKIRKTTANQSRFAMPIDVPTFGAAVCAGFDAPVRTHVSALFEGATQGTTVWSSPPG